MAIKINGQLAAYFPDGLAGIIFDCDGVMIDSADANRAFYNIILASLGLPPITREQEEYAFMATAEQALKRMVPEIYHGHLPEIIKKNVDYEKDILPKIKLMPGFREFINLAHARGLLLAIDTNRTDFGINRVLEFFKLTSWFNPVITSSSFEPKPSPQGVKWIAEFWHVRTDQCLFVGDSENDQKTASNSGAEFVAFNNPALDASIKARSYDSLALMLFGIHF